MLTIPNVEQERFTLLVEAEARRYGMMVRDYLRKVWYHEAATKFGEYVALSQVDELISLTDEYASMDLDITSDALS